MLADVAEHGVTKEREQILLEHNHSSHIKWSFNVLEVTSTIVQLHHTL